MASAEHKPTLQHGHAHHTHATTFGATYRVGVLLNVGYVAIEVGYGYANGSIALISDGFHNLSDVAGMLLSWGAFALLRRQPNRSYTYGYGRATILAAFLNAIILLVAVGGLGLEAINRLSHPTAVPGGLMAIVSGVGILVNGVTAFMFFRDRKHDINMKSTFLHMSGDAAVSAGVLVSGLIISRTGWWLLDPLMSLVILVVIVLSTWQLFTESIRQILDHVPSHIDMEELEHSLLTQQGVLALHDLHVWSITTNQAAMTTHLLIDHQLDSNVLLDEVTDMLRVRFNIEQTTIQVEYSKPLLGCIEE